MTTAERTSRRWIVALAATAVGLGTLVAAPSYAAGVCDTAPRSIVCENTKAGTPESVWGIDGSGDPTIQGFASSFSTNVGGRVDFKIKTNASAYSINVYRMGYYGGAGARLVTTVPVTANLPQTQPGCVTDTSTDLVDCGNWGVSASWTIPADAVAGVYFADLVRSDTSGNSHITFVVRDDASHSDIVFQTSDTTWQAYNDFGGASLYKGVNQERAYKVSYNRPFNTNGVVSGRDFLFSNEYPMIRFLERNGYDVSYISGLDTDVRGSLLLNHKVFLSTGHDEYWSGGQRAAVEAARDAGVNLAFFSGNEIYWKTRWEPSIDGSATANRTLVTYKETKNDRKIDPSIEWTGTWRDPRFSTEAHGGNRPENGLSGTLFMSNSDDLALTVSSAEGKLRIWRGTPLASLSSGQSATLAPHTVGYESDENLDNGSRPGGLINVSTTTGATPEYLQDFGSVVAPGTTTHNMTLYRAASGALVFGAGTIQFAWGLDDQHTGIQSPADSRMQQMVINLLADMSVQPATLMSGLTAASKSSDTQAPTTTITSPTAGTTVANGTKVTVTGTAADLGGGQVAGVEVSSDGGTTWHPATGTASWAYSFYATGTSAVVVKARATDDSLNTTSSPTSVTYSTACPCSIFGAQVPKTAATTDTSSVELGLRFSSAADGFISGVRFYKGTGNTGTHTGSLWSATGALLASGTFTGETASGWQTLTFSAPVAITANTVYTASYRAPSGHYAADSWAFSSADYVAAPLKALRSLTGLAGPGNGVYTDGSTAPTDAFRDTNYWVDPVFVIGAQLPPKLASSTPIDRATSVPASTKPAGVLTKDITQSTLTMTVVSGSGTSVAGTVAYDAPTRTATFTPGSALAAGTSYTVTIGASDTGGLAMTPATWTFRTAEPTPPPGVYPRSIWNDSTVPATVDVSDPASVELGVKFTSDTDGTISGVRFYKGLANTGTHTGSLWSSTGALLANVTFSNEGSVGWQTATFPTPVPISAGTVYTVSYHAPAGHYSATSGAFAGAGFDNPPLHVAASGGVYTYGTGAPTSSSTASYAVDVVFTGSTSTPTPTPTPTFSSPPVTLFPTSSVPAVSANADNSAVQLGTKFVPARSGQVVGVRFYKGATNVGTHTGSLWSSTGTRLAQVTFTGETASGWQTAYFTTPVAVTGGTTYVISYMAPNGNYSSTGGFFNAAYVNGDLSGPAGANGVFAYGNDLFPTGSWNSTSYWVDPLVVLDAAPSPTPTPTPNPTPTFSSPPVSLLPSAGVPAVASANDTAAVQLGMKFVSDNSGKVVGLRFFKGAANTGVHSGSLWDAIGTRLATVTFANETATGWQTAYFTTPVDIAAGATYVISYQAPNGGYSVTSSFFNSDYANGDLTAPGGDNGVFGYGNDVFPTGSWASTNYWVDPLVVYPTATPPPPPPPTYTTLFPSTSVPVNPNWNDTRTVQVGMKFSSSVAGSVYGVRFYKGSLNTGTHTGTLWSATGTQLATGTFTNETASGWQTLLFTTPVPITPGTMYTVSYRAPVGRYSVDTNVFRTAFTSGTFTVPASGSVYSYRTGVPTTASTAKYWVDVLFR